MIEILPESTGNIIGFRASGKLTDADYKETLIPKFESALNSFGKVKVVFEMGEEFHGWELKAAWDDANFGVRHRNDFEKCAIVGGPKWVEWAAKISAHIMSGEVKTYPCNEVTEAWTWIKS